MYTESEIIRAVRLSEKSSSFTGQRQKCVFEVCASANKVQIRHAVEKAFGKRVFSVNTSVHMGKVRRKGTRQQGRAAVWKKAVVTLQKGEVLEFV